MARIRMFSRLDSFIQSHMSTSTSATWSADDLKQQLVIKVIEDVLANSNIGLVKPMAKKDWKKLVKSITEQHRPSPEREGVHPRLFQILKNISRGSLYQWVYDQSNEDSDGIITIPDFSKFQAGDHILDLEAKCEKLILRAVQQSEGHLVCKIRGNIEMSGVLNSESEYFGICLGSDGIQLAVSTITVSLDSFIITRTSLRNPVELWPPSTETPA